MTFGTESLWFFGWIVIFGTALLIVLPYLAGRSQLLTTFNMLLLGMIPFVGSSSIACATVQGHYANYASGDYLNFYLGALLFFVAAPLSYRLLKPPRMATRFLAGAPRTVPSLPFVTAGLAVVLVMLGFAATRGLYIPLVSEFVVRVAPAGAAYASFFAFSGWMKNRNNPALLICWLGIFFLCLIMAVMSGGGRRNLLGVLLAIPFYFYWVSWNRVSRAATLLLVGAGMLLLFLFITAYSEVRHFDRGRDRVQRTFRHSLDAVMEVPNRIVNIGATLNNTEFHNSFGQNTTNCTLYCIYLSRRKTGAANAQLQFPSPFYSLRFVALNPIPRRIWKDKPLGLGYILAKNFNRQYQVNWGPGVVGHGFHEGGFIFVLFYAVFFGYLFKIIDTALQQNSQNLFLLGFCVSITPHTIGLVRGDVAILLLNILFCFIFFLFIRMLGYWLYGRQQRRMLLVRRPMVQATG